jgi:hypothetical protein
MLKTLISKRISRDNDDVDIKTAKIKGQRLVSLQKLRV